MRRDRASRWDQGKERQVDGQAEGWMDIYVHIWNDRVSLVAQSIKNLPAVQETGFDPWVRKIACWGAWQPTPVFWPGESHGQSSLAGYSPWGHTESDATERLHFHFICGMAETYMYTHTHRPLKEAEWETHWNGLFVPHPRNAMASQIPVCTLPLQKLTEKFGHDPILIPVLLGNLAITSYNCRTCSFTRENIKLSFPFVEQRLPWRHFSFSETCKYGRNSKQL